MSSCFRGEYRCFSYSFNERTKVKDKTEIYLRLSIHLFYYYPSTGKTFYFKPSKSVDKDLKNHYIISNKTAINKDKNTSKKQVCN